MYCSIEEAWGTSNLSNNKKDNKGNVKRSSNQKKKKEGFSNYEKVNYPDADIYNSLGESIYGNNLKSQKQKEDNSYRFDFSRSTDRLPNTNGPKKRVKLPLINIENDDIDENMVEQESGTEVQEENYYNNLENINQEENNELDYINNQEDNNYDNQDHINKNISTNKSLENIVNKLNLIIRQIDNSINNESSNSDSNNVNDLLLYIITGIFFIFILEIFIKLGKKF